MYFLIIVLGLICVGVAFIHQNIENNARTKDAIRKFNNTEIAIFKDTKDFFGRCPIKSSRYVCGRKSSFFSDVDIPGPSTDKTLSKHAALFLVKDGSFYIRRINQMVIWVSRAKEKKNYLLKADEVPLPVEVPPAVRILGVDRHDYEYVKNDVSYFPLRSGDRILMGNTIFVFRKRVSNDE